MSRWQLDDDYSDDELSRPASPEFGGAGSPGDSAAPDGGAPDAEEGAAEEGDGAPEDDDAEDDVRGAADDEDDEAPPPVEHATDTLTPSRPTHIIYGKDRRLCAFMSAYETARVVAARVEIAEESGEFFLPPGELEGRTLKERAELELARRRCPLAILRPLDHTKNGEPVYEYWLASELYLPHLAS